MEEENRRMRGRHGKRRTVQTSLNCCENGMGRNPKEERRRKVWRKC